MIAPFGNLVEFSKLYRCARRRNHGCSVKKIQHLIVFTMVQQVPIVLTIRRCISGMQSSMIAPFGNLVDLIELYQIPKRSNHRTPHPRNTASNSEHLLRLGQQATDVHHWHTYLLSARVCSLNMREILIVLM